MFELEEWIVKKVIGWALCLDFNCYTALLLVCKQFQALVRQVLIEHPMLNYVDADLWKPILVWEPFLTATHQRYRQSLSIRGGTSLYAYEMVEALVFKEEPRPIEVCIGYQKLLLKPVGNVIWLSFLCGKLITVETQGRFEIIFHVCLGPYLHMHMAASAIVYLNQNKVTIGSGKPVDWLSSLNRCRAARW